MADGRHGEPRAEQPLDEADGHRSQRATSSRQWRGDADLNYGLQRKDPQPVSTVVRLETELCAASAAQTSEKRKSCSTIFFSLLDITTAESEWNLFMHKMQTYSLTL